MEQVPRTGIGALLLLVLLTGGCAGTPQPPDAGGAGGSGAVPTGTAVPSRSPSATTAPATAAATGGAPSSTKGSSVVGTEAPTGKDLPDGWPGVPLPPGTITEAVKEGGGSTQTLWRVIVTSPGTVEATASSLKSRYEAAGWTIASDTTIPNAGRVLTTRNAKYGVSLMAKGRGEGTAEVETLVRTLT